MLSYTLIDSAHKIQPSRIEQLKKKTVILDNEPMRAMICS